MTVKQGIIAAVKVSASKETVPARCLFLFSIFASIRNLLGYLVVNKIELPYFNLIKRSRASPHSYIMHLSGTSNGHLDGYVYLPECRQGLFFIVDDLRDGFFLMGKKERIAQNWFGESAKSKWHLALCYNSLYFKIIRRWL